MIVDLLLYILFSTTMYIYFSYELLNAISIKYTLKILPAPWFCKLLLAGIGFFMGIFKL